MAAERFLTAEWLYIRSELRLWTVGHYSPSGEWHAASDHDTPEEAANRVRFLNGGGSVNAALLAACEGAAALLRKLGGHNHDPEYAELLAAVAKAKGEP